MEYALVLIDGAVCIYLSLSDSGDGRPHAF